MNGFVARVLAFGVTAVVALFLVFHFHTSQDVAYILAFAFFLYFSLLTFICVGYQRRECSLINQRRHQ